MSALNLVKVMPVFFGLCTTPSCLCLNIDRKNLKPRQIGREEIRHYSQPVNEAKGGLPKYDKNSSAPRFTAFFNPVMSTNSVNFT